MNIHNMVYIAMSLDLMLFVFLSLSLSVSKCLIRFDVCMDGFYVLLIIRRNVVGDYFSNFPFYFGRKFFVVAGAQ